MATRATESQLKVKRIVEECAKLYDRNLCERHVLFGPTDGTRPYETYFPADCFFHLCGIRYKNKAQRVSAKKFFDLALQGKIDPKLFEAKYTKYTEAKLSILYQLVRIDSTGAKIAPMPLVRYGATKAEILIFNMDFAMGFRIDRSGKTKSLIPCTALYDRVPKQTDEKNIGFVLKTDRNEMYYRHRIKPKGEMTEQQESNMRRVTSKYHGDFWTFTR